MKPDIHPTLNPVVFVDTSCGAEFVTTSTLKSDDVRMIDGVEHYVVHVEVSSASHPFYTGKQRLVDTTGMVDKFMARQQAAKQKQAISESAKTSKMTKDKESIEEKITRKVLEKEEEKAKEAAEKQVKKKEVAKKRAEKTVVKKKTAEKKVPKKAPVAKTKKVKS